MRHVLASIATTVLLTVPGPAGAQAAHEHGVARLDVAVETAQLTLRLEGPGDTFAGFEHAAETEAERAAVRAAHARLEDADALFAFAGNECRVGRVAVALPRNLAAASPASTPEEAGHDHGHAHVDWTVDLVFACGSAPGWLDVAGLFQAFPNLHELRTQAIGPGGQAGATLTADASRIMLP